MGFGKFIKKHVKKLAVGAGRAALASITGGGSEVALKAGKVMGGAAKTISRQKAAKRLGKATARDRMQEKKISGSSVANQSAVAMPGGAKIKDMRRSTAPSRRKKAAPKPKKAKKAPKMPRPKKPITTTSGKRIPPKGGLDLAAMSKAWAAAGKPGKWIDWIKKNPIKK